MGRPKKIDTVKYLADDAPIDEKYTEGHTYYCTRCGKKVSNPVSRFLKSKWSEQYSANDGYVNICKECCNAMFNNFRARYDSDKQALISMCAILDWYYSANIYNSVIENSNVFTLGKYGRQLNNKQFSSKTFITSLTDGQICKQDTEVWQEHEEKWSKEEQRKRDAVLEVYRYDPFPISDYTDKDRKYLFANLMDYFDDDIEEDKYKRDVLKQVVLNNYSIERNMAQKNRLNPIIDAQKIKDLTDIIAKDVTNNDKLAKENEISIANRKNREVGENTFTGLQKKLKKYNFEQAEVDYYSQLKSPSTQWLLESSLHALSEHTYFDEADKQEMLNIQRNLISQKDKEIDELKEKVRLINVEIEKAQNEKAQSLDKESDL